MTQYEDCEKRIWCNQCIEMKRCWFEHFVKHKLKNKGEKDEKSK